MPRYPKKAVSKKKIFTRVKKNSGAITKRLSSLEKRMKVVSHNVQFQQFESNISVATVGFILLTNYNSWEWMFPQTGPVGYPINYQATHKKTVVNMVVKKNNPAQTKEQQSVTYTIFLVSPKDNRGLVSLQNKVDYVNNDGQAYVNTKAWHIHDVKRVILPSDDSGPAEKHIKLTTKRFNRRVVNTGGNATATQDWKTMTINPDPSDNLYLLVFNNDPADAEYSALSYSALHSMVI